MSRLIALFNEDGHEAFRDALAELVLEDEVLTDPIDKKTIQKLILVEKPLSFDLRRNNATCDFDSLLILYYNVEKKRFDTLAWGKRMEQINVSVFEPGYVSDRCKSSRVLTDRRLKNAFLESLLEDIAAVKRREKAIKYLVVDSDASKLKEQTGRLTDIDENTEFFSLANESSIATFADKKVMENRPELYWLDFEHIPIDDANNCAGGIRQVGRFLLVDRAQMLYAKIKSEMTSALQAAETGNLNVHICAGISGGTGSGTFIDVCYLVRRALEEIGKPESRVCGYFFLPDVNLSVPEIIKNPLISDYIKVNGYAALQELDYCMNYGRNKDSFKMNYGFTKVDYSMKPVDLCYLVSTTDSSGNHLQNG